MGYRWSVRYFIICSIVITLCVVIANGMHPDVDLSFEDRVRRHGYPLDIHQITTEDDYILSLYHIPYGLHKLKPESDNKSVVLLIHGMGGSPHNFVIFGKKDSLPYYFADRGFDVWLFCARGVAGSFKKKHKKWDWDNDNEYWEYSLHEIAVFDLAATMDYILTKSSQKRMFLIGHSAGGNEINVLLSERPEYNDKVKMSASYASSPILKRCDYPLLSFLAAIVDFWRGLFKYLGMTEFFPQFQILNPTFKKLCADPKWKKVCIIGSWIVGSHESVLQHPADIEVIASTAPPRVANQQIFHFMDNYNYGEFRKCNYGSKKNMKIYGEKLPPKYNLSASLIPMAFFLGPRDSIVIKEDIYEAMEELPNVVLLYNIPFEKFTHTDFIFARNASNLVYEPTYKLFKDFDEGVVPPKVVLPVR